MHSHTYALHVHTGLYLCTIIYYACTLLSYALYIHACTEPLSPAVLSIGFEQTTYTFPESAAGNELTPQICLIVSQDSDEPFDATAVVEITINPFTATAQGEQLDCLNLAICLVCLLYTSPSPRDATLSRMPSSA